MTQFKTIFILAIFSILAIHANSQIKFGAGVSALLDNSSAIGVQGKALYSATEQIDVAGGFTFYFAEFVDYAIDINGHYNLTTLGENISFAPIAGLNITSFSSGFGNFSNTSLQIGAHFKIPTEKLTIYVEPKIILDGGSFVISGGVLF